MEVLRVPQGTLFGRKATSGVVNVVTAKPKLSRFEAEAQFEYGNFNSIEARSMVNVPIGDMIGVRLAGINVSSDGYSTNFYDGTDIDTRDPIGKTSSRERGCTSVLIQVVEDKLKKKKHII